MGLWLLPRRANNQCHALVPRARTNDPSCWHPPASSDCPPRTLQPEPPSPSLVPAKEDCWSVAIPWDPCGMPCRGMTVQYSQMSKRSNTKLSQILQWWRWKMQWLLHPDTIRWIRKRECPSSTGTDFTEKDKSHFWSGLGKKRNHNKTLQETVASWNSEYYTLGKGSQGLFPGQLGNRKDTGSQLGKKWKHLK